jgi:hypothetical protein
MSSKNKTKVKELSYRTSYLDSDERWSLVILGKETGKRPLLRYAWLVAWLIIGIIVVLEADRLGSNEDVRMILMVFMAFWAYYLYKIIRAVRWHQVGKEMLMIKGDLLLHKNSYGEVGRSREYDLSMVRQMKMRQPTEGFASLFEDSFWSNGIGSIELPIAAHSLLIGKRLSVKESEQVIARFNKELKKRAGQ